MPDDPDLAALLGSRICHDLISPLGAIGNGVELILLEGGRHSPEMALISESVAHASARIRFFRVAFGTGTAEQRMGRPEVASILADITRGGRLKVEWQPAGDLLRREVKLVFLAFLCLETAMPWGGSVIFERTGAGWRVEARAPRLRHESGLWEVAAGAPAPEGLSAAQVHFALFGRELDLAGRALQVTRHAEGIGLAF